MALFLLMLWAPLLQQRFELFSYEALVENRLKKERPRTYRDLFAEGTPFARKYEEYFNDAFGFRDLLIRVKHQLDYWLFHENDKVVIGSDGWLFYKSVVEVEEYYIEHIDEPTWARIESRLRRMARDLTSRGMTLVVVPCPMGDTIYPEHLPRAARWRRSPTGFDRYRQILRKIPEIVVLDPTPMLVALKDRMQVYHKTDFHWTDPAAAEVAKELVGTLGRLSGERVPWRVPVSTRVVPQTAGGENAAMGLLFPFVEQSLEVAVDRTPGPDRTRGVGPNEWSFTAGPVEGRLLPPTVMFGDSYADGFVRAGMLEHFSRFQKFFNWDLVKKYGEIPEGTRFVVLQHIETYLNGLANDALWPEHLRSTEAEAPATEQTAQRAEPTPRAAPEESERRGNTIAAEPNPVKICRDGPPGVTTLTWKMDPPGPVEVRVGTPDGPLLAFANGSGSARTGAWMAETATFYLRRAQTEAPPADRILATVVVRVEKEACPAP